MTIQKAPPDVHGSPAALRAGQREAHAPSVESQLRRFDPTVRRRVRGLVRRHARLGELVQTFPGALHALASEPADGTNRRTRDEVLTMIEDGARLKDVARELQLPFWMRRLPPEAFHGGPPRLCTSARFDKQIATRLPLSRSGARAWLEAVTTGLDAAHEPFALWLAERPGLHPRDAATRTTAAVLAAYAWASTELDADAEARQLIVTPWHPDLTTTRALHAVMSWLKRIYLVTALQEPADEPWLTPSDCDGYTFVPLRTATELLEESRLMRNCVDHYARAIKELRCQIYSVRSGRTRVATLEIGPHPKDLWMHTVLQLRGPANVQASSDVWAAAYRWLASQGSALSVRQDLILKRRPAVTASPEWQRLFAAYFAARPQWQGLPRTVTCAALNSLHVDIVSVAREAGISTWRYS